MTSAGVTEDKVGKKTVKNDFRGSSGRRIEEEKSKECLSQALRKTKWRRNEQGMTSARRSDDELTRKKVRNVFRRRYGRRI